MKRRVAPVLAVLLLPAVVLLLPGCSAGDAQLQEPTGVIGPDVLEALQTEAQVEVLIGLKEPDMPMAEWTTQLRRENTAEVQASVLSVLTDADFTLLRQFEISAALSGRMTESGLEKLATHPDVVSVALNCCLFVPDGGKPIGDKAVDDLP